MFAAVAMGIITGVFLSCQSPTNAALGKTVGSVQATLTSFCLSLVLCALVVAFWGSGDIAKIFSVPVWQLLGGLYGALSVVVSVYVTPKLGVALTMASLMLGELVGGVWVDSFGLAGASIIPATPLRIAGCVVACIGILLVLRGTAGDGKPTKRQLVYLFIPFATMVLASLQPSTNATLAATIGTLEASLLNFITGALALLVVSLVVGRGKLRSYAGAKPWHFTGGLYGLFGIIAMVSATPILGTSLWNVCTMLGQLVGSMVVDARGLFATVKRPVNGWRMAGAVVLVVGIVMVTYAKVVGA